MMHPEVPPNVQSINYYIFVATSLDREPYTSGREIVQVLADQNRIWLAAPRTPFRQSLKTGDRVLFYVGGDKARYILGYAELADGNSDIIPADQAIVDRLGLIGFIERIPLKDVHLWRDPIRLADIVNDLEFVKNKKYYGLNLIKSVVLIPKTDYNLIVTLGDASQRNL